MSRLLAIAQLTVRAAWRLRAVAPVAALLALIVGLLPALLTDDGTLVGRLRILLTYLLGLSQALLCLFSAWFAAESIARDIGEQPIQVIVTKPVARWQLWLGRWLGLMAVNAGFLILVGLGLSWQVQRAFAGSKWDDEQRAEARAEVLTARSDHWPEAPETGHRQERAASTDWRTVAPGETRVWRYRGVATGSGPLTVRFRFLAGGPLPALGARGSWSLGDQPVRGQWSAETLHRVSLAGAGRGELTLSFKNDSDQSLAFPRGEGPVLLRPTGDFAGNLRRALGLCWLQLGLLTALGLSCGALFSFPVAAFVLLGYLLVAWHVPLVAGQLQQGFLLAGPHGPAAPAWLETIARGFVRFGLWLTSGLHRFWPLPRLADGLTISGPFWRLAVVHLGLLQTGLVAVVGNLLFARRELGAGDRL